MADVSGILAAGNIGKQAGEGAMQPLTVMQTLQGIQNQQAQNKLYQQQLLNKQQELENLKLTNQTGNYNLANAQQTRAQAILFSLGNRSDAELTGGKPLYDAIQREQQGGMLTQEAANNLRAQVDQVTQAGGSQNGAAYRPLLNSLFSRNMPTAEAVQYLQGQTHVATNPDGSSSVVMTPGIGAPAGAQNRTLGGSFGGGLTPSEQVATQTLYNPDTGRPYTATNQQIRQATQGGGASSTAPTPASTPANTGASTGAGGTGSGGTQPSTGGTTQQPPSATSKIQSSLGSDRPLDSEITLSQQNKARQQEDLQNLSSKNFNDIDRKSTRL